MTFAALKTKTTEIENKIPGFANLPTKAALNIKAAEVESKINYITNVAIKAALKTKATRNENKMPDTTGFITTSEFERLTKINVDVRMRR